MSVNGTGDAGGSVGTVQNIMGVLYSCTTFLGMFNMMSVMPILGYERSVMYRSVLLLHSSSSSFLRSPPLPPPPLPPPLLCPVLLLLLAQPL